jgi:hypothetical protein
VAYLVLTWHEVATWFGYRTFFFDESRSAFTYDDTVATLVGMRVGARAMAADEGRDFDAAVTAGLGEELRRLGAVTPAQTERAVRAVEGVWWAGDAPLKRQADVCPAEVDVVRPWVVPNLFTDGESKVETFALPRLVEPPDARPAITATVEIEPRIAEAERMRGLLPERRERFRDDRELPALMRAMQAEMRERYGPEVCRPWPGDSGLPRIESAHGREPVKKAGHGEQQTGRFDPLRGGG